MRSELITSTAPILSVTRGPLVENVVRGMAALVNHQGKILASLGHVQTTCYMRSVAKPFQAVPFLMSGAADHFGLTEEEIAIAAASHNGELYHQRLVLSILKKGKIAPAHLQCGVKYPLYPVLKNEMRQKKIQPKPLHGDCSGKHAGMLLTAKYQHFPLHSYRELYHPIQQAVLKTVCELSETHENQISVGVDGCGVPTFGLPLHKIAYLYARLGLPDMPYGYQKAVGRVAQAMQRYPHAVAGTGRFDTDLMEARPGLISKTGADAIYTLSIPEKGLGFAMKIESGRDDKLFSHAVLEFLAQLKVVGPKHLGRLKSHRIPAIINNHRAAVGEVHALFKWR